MGECAETLHISGDHTLAEGPQPYLDEWEGGSRLQGLVLVLLLVSHVLLHPLLRVDFPLRDHVEEGAGGDRHGDGIPGFGLPGPGMDTGAGGGGTTNTTAHWFGSKAEECALKTKPNKKTNKLTER